MKKNGFTLIELLAVIVILAIIALIATPIVLNIIEDSKKSAVLRGAEYYLDAIEYSLLNKQMKNSEVEDGEYDILSNGNICIEGSASSCTKELQVDVSGEIPNSGTVKIKQNKVVYLEVVYDGTTIILPKPVSFAKDSWEIIIANIQAGNVDAYKNNVGQVKTIALTGYDSDLTYGSIIAGDYKVRLANTTTTADCEDEDFSETACGFVIEFVDIITAHVMNEEEETSIGGWPASAMYDYVNGTIYNAIEDVVRNAIIDTSVVSEYEKNKTENYTSTDKLYLLSTKEIYGTEENEDTVTVVTRQLDYYSSSEAIKRKYLNGTAKSWWLRSAYSGRTDSFYLVKANGSSEAIGALSDSGVAPAFRLG